MAKLFLGLDSSTQSLSAVVIDYDSRKVVYDKSLNFDHALPQYQTQNGVLPNPEPLVKHGPPLMWADALDLLFAGMKKDGVVLGNLLAISGSGQQHGSVYLNHRAADALAGLNPAKPLVENLAGIFSRKTSPIWMDSSTAAECAEIRQALGGIKATAQKTGSDAFERFTGPQIRKFYKTEPDACAQTASIALVSSFMASLLAGKIVPIDHGDGAGMNLMDIRKKIWHPDALKATAPDLDRKLPPLAEPWKVVGAVSPYFVKKFGVNPDAQALVWSGDNPCSVIGLGLIKAGRVAISLGTSDTFFGSMKKCHTDAHGEGHVFGSPAGYYMTLICFKNGSLAREKIREQYGIGDWNEFGKQLASTPPGNRGGILLPWFEPEMVPRVNQPALTVLISTKRRRCQLPRRRRVESDGDAAAFAMDESRARSYFRHRRRLPGFTHSTSHGQHDELPRLNGSRFPRARRWARRCGRRTAGSSRPGKNRNGKSRGRVHRSGSEQRNPSEQKGGEDLRPAG